MTERTADAVVGMMDAAYFIGRKELLDFFNNLLDLKLTKIEQTATGAIACQIAELIFPGSIPLSKIDWSAKSDYEYVQNYKLLQNAFNKHRVQRHVDVDKLIRAKYQDNLEFCQWLKAFYDQSGAYRENYDPSAVRAKGKGGKQYNITMGGSKARTNPSVATATNRGNVGMAARSTVPSSSTASRVNTSHRPTPTTATTKPITTASTASGNPIRDVSRPLRERTAAVASNNTISSVAQSTSTSDSTAAIMADAALMKKNADLTNKNEQLELAVLEIEKERDFYFEKLRNVEVLLQIYQEKGGTATIQPDVLIDNVFKILYATAEDNLTVNEDGEVVPFNHEDVDTSNVTSQQPNDDLHESNDIDDDDDELFNDNNNNKNTSLAEDSVIDDDDNLWEDVRTKDNK